METNFWPSFPAESFPDTFPEPDFPDEPHAHGAVTAGKAMAGLSMQSGPARAPGSNLKTSLLNGPSSLYTGGGVPPLHDSLASRGGLPAKGSIGPRPLQSLPMSPSPEFKCIISVHYEEGEQPMNELLRLGGGQGMDVLVEAVAPDSKAFRAGVKPGFALLSMNNRKEFVHLPGWQVRLLLEPPITLKFDPEPIQASSAKCTEIRLTKPANPLGIPSRKAVCGPMDTALLAEEVIFKTSAAPLWLSSWGDERLSEKPEVAAQSGRMPHVYELRRPEAHAIVGDAVRGARRCVQEMPPFEADFAASSSGSRRARRLARSPSPFSQALCTLDCVADCVDADVEADLDRPPRVGRLFSSPRGRDGPTFDAWLGGNARKGEPNPHAGPKRYRSPVSSAGAEAPRHGRTGRPCQSRVSPRAESSEEEDPDEEARGKSPLRWLAPYIEPLLERLSPSRSPSASRRGHFVFPGGLSPSAPPHSGSPTPNGSEACSPSEGAQRRGPAVPNGLPRMPGGNLSPRSPRSGSRKAVIARGDSNGDFDPEGGLTFAQSVATAHLNGVPMTVTSKGRPIAALV
jgi:hypothetical protein